MRLRKYEFALRYLSLLLLPTLSCTMNLDCKNIRDNKQSFDVSALGNPISVMTSQNHFPSPTMTNTTFTMDICKPLNKAKGIAKEEDCPNGSRGMALPHFLDDSGSASSKSYRLRLYGHAVCGIEMLINTYENITVLQGAIPIAGQYTLHHGVELDPKITRFKTSSSASDREKEGFRLELHGLKYPADNGLKQKAIIEFLCQNKAEGKGSEERNLLSTTDERRAIEEDIVVKTDGDDDGEEDHSATGEVADDGHGGTLTYKAYEVVGETKVLSLEWRTKYACEDSKENDSETKKSNHWGFFTWFIIMYVPLSLTQYTFPSVNWLSYRLSPQT